MKRLTKFNCLLISILFYSFNIAQATEKIITQTQSVPLSFSFKSAIKQHGFCADTLIQTPFGYKEIKKFTEGDIVINCNGEEKRIIAITKHFVSRYIKLVVGDTIIYTGYDQLYYKFPGNWIAAQDIKVGDVLLNYANEDCLITYAELIYENELLYSFTVEGHTFCMAPQNLCIHNAEALILGASSLCLGSIAIINPIVTTIGATIALSVIGRKAYQTYMEQCLENDQKIVLPAEVEFAERFYYIQRLNALEEIKQELIYIKNGLKNIKFLCRATSTSFTYQFLQESSSQNTYNQNQLLKVSVKDESLLSDKQKENLRKLRECELECFEQEIIDLQCALATHVNELIQQLSDACDEYNKEQEQISNAVALWNNNRSNMTYAIALQLYKATFLQEYLVTNFNQRLNELKMVAQYYASCTNITCIKQSTNIIEILEKLTPVIVEHNQLIATESVHIASNIAIAEKHFARRGISIPHLKDGIKNELSKSRNGQNVQAIAEAKNKLAKIVAASGSPKKDPEEDDENEKRIINKITKTEFFKKIKDEYEHYRNGTYKRKRGAKGIENSEYIEWDHLHNDVEAYNKAGRHIGSIDPKTLKLYKGPVLGREFSLK